MRTRPQRNRVEKNTNEQNGEDLECETVGDFLSDNNDSSSVPQKKRKGRGITKLTEIFARTPNMPKIKIDVNEFGQPVGDTVKKFTRAIGCLVRRKLSVDCADWRLVKDEKKFEVWTDIKQIYDISEDAFNWFLTTSGKKWKEFKSTLKKQYFDENITNAELKAMHEGRVNDADWLFLSNYWRSPNCVFRTGIAKENCSKLGMHHTSGSKSFACSRHELGEQLGRPPRRDEVFIKTHTRKDGVPARHAEPIINKLKATIEEHPDLVNRTIQEGDVFAAACGEKEPRGRVRVLGLGPIPQDISTPGLKSYIPTRHQMEVLARKRAEHEIVALRQRLAELEALQEERMAHERENVEIISHDGSNSRHHVRARCEEHGEDEASYDSAASASDHSGDEGEFMTVNRRVVAPRLVDHNQGSPTSVAPALQQNQGSPTSAALAVQQNQGSPTSAAPPVQSHRSSPVSAAPSSVPRNDAPCCQHSELVGKVVILYAMLRPDQPVAKGTIVSTNPDSILKGVALGKQYCEVVVNVVLKRDTILPRPYDGVETMANAHNMPIAWPYQRLKVTKSSQSSQGVVGRRS
ncbi:unnamed protein product [Urochloa humidicola]